MLTILLLFTSLAAPVTAGQNPPLAITAPTDGTVVNPGQSFSVTVMSPSGQTFTGVVVLGEGFMGAIGSADTLPAQFTVTVPLDVASRKYTLSVMAGVQSGEPLTATIQVAVERTEFPTAIRAEIPQMVFSAQGQAAPISLQATFSDGSVADVTRSSNVTYVTSNPDVASVDENGMVTGVGGGVAEITATYTVSSESRRALIRVIVPPPPYTVSPNQLDFGEQEVGTSAAQQMTLTNSSAQSLNIVEVVASSDFTVSDTCVAASPLAKDATCSITVTFTPSIAGVRDGVLQISEADNVIRFQLKGTGVSQPAVTTISGFAPTAGPVGTAVTIAGSGFSTTPLQNTVTFNGVAATVTAATATSIEVTVPAGATTGPISVTAPTGSDTGATFTVPAPPTISEFAPTSGPVGTPVTIAGSGFSTTPSQNAVTFNGIAAAVTSATATSIEVTVPAGATTGPVAVTAPTGSATSATPFAVTPPEPPTITGFSPPIGVAGTSVTISGTNFAIVPASNQVKFNQSPATPTEATSTTISVSVPAGTGSGQIAITTPAGTAVSASDFIIPPSPHVAADVEVSGRIAFNTATPITVQTANKIGLMLFDGTAGQRVSLRGTNGVTGQILGCDLNVSILKPDAGVLATPTCMEGGGFIDVKTLPTTGTYTILADPAGAATGGVTLTLYDVAADVSAMITPGGSAVTVSISTPGQNAAVTFSSTAGQRISLRGTNGITAQIGLACDVNVSIRKSDSTVLAPNTCMEGSGYIDVTTLPATGTYTILVDPNSYAIGNLTLTLYDVPPDVTSTITPNGSPVTVSLGTPGQKATLTFPGAAGQFVSLLGTNGLSGQIGLGGCDVTASILKPDGAVLSGASECMEGSGFIDTRTLQSAGTYSIVVDPASYAVGDLTLQLYGVTDYAGTLTAGTSVTVNMPTPGQNATLTFTGTAGQRISLRGTNGLSGQIGLGACDVNTSITNPDGSSLAPATCMEGSGFVDVRTLPATGTYTVFVNPTKHATGNLTLTLFDVPADTAQPIVIGDAAAAVPLATPGQNASLTFSGTAGQQVTVRMTLNTFGTITVRLLRPDGSQLTSATSAGSTFNLATQTLPATGTYTIVVDPSGANTGSVSARVTNP